MDGNIRIYITSSDSVEYFPDNNGTSFRVKLSEPLTFSGTWEAVLTSLSIVVNETDTGDILTGLDIEVLSNLVGLSIVGGQKKQVLRRINLGRPIVNTHSKTIFHVVTLENYCFYIPVITQECSVIEIGLQHPSLYIKDILADSKVSATLHLKRVR